MPAPTIIFSEYSDIATASASSTASGLDAGDVLFAAEDTFWKPAVNDDGTFLEIDRESTEGFDHLVLLGENLDGIKVGLAGSTDVFVADASVIGTERVTDPDFSTGGASGTPWTIASGSAWTYPSSGGTSIDGSQTAEDKQTEADILTINQTYLVLIVVSGTASANGDLYAELGTARGPAISSDGFHYQMITADGTDFSLVADAASAGDFAGTIDSVHIVDALTITALLNASYNALDVPSTLEHIRLVFSDFGTNLQIAHAGLSTALTLPSFRDDWDKYNAKPEGLQQVSGTGRYLGSVVEFMMREFKFVWPPQALENTAEIASLITFGQNAVERLLPFFFIPDATETDAYFCWLLAKSKWSLPTENKTNKKPAQVTAITRGR